MEDIIIFAVIAISIVANIVSNYKKEAKKNAKRVIGQPAPVSAPTTSTQQKVKSAQKKKKSAPAETIFSLEDIHAEGKQEIKRTHDTDSIYELADAKEADYSQDTDNLEKNPYQLNKVETALNNKDELKKAIIYSVILERKF